MTDVKGFITHEKVTGVIMFITMDMSFIKWLEAEMRARELSISEMARRSGVSQSAISLVLKGDRNPGTAFCDGVAIAFKIPPDTVYRMAGLLPSKPNADETVTEIEHIYHQLTDDNRTDLLDYARSRLHKQERENDKQSSRTSSHRSSIK
jgi:transcriptional regulator with XRE-family HTH domain